MLILMLSIGDVFIRYPLSTVDYVWYKTILKQFMNEKIMHHHLVLIGKTLLQPDHVFGSFLCARLFVN